MRNFQFFAAIAFTYCSIADLKATETENFGLHVLRAAAPVMVDGTFGDWDLRGGAFICDNVEVRRDKLAVWIHAMHDAENLYLLARFVDETPLNNPGQVGGDSGFQGDSLQVRFLFGRGTPQERISHWTCWRGSNGKDVLEVAYANFGTNKTESSLKDGKNEGAQQAFSVNADGKGYAQEIAIPWKLLTRDGKRPTDNFEFTVEPNFSIGAGSRLTMKDIFKSGLPAIDRVFTFMNDKVWGEATLENTSSTIPRPVRLSDGREFPVSIDQGVPAVNWAGLIHNEEMPGFKEVNLNIPADGYVSLQIVAKDGTVVRQLINQTFMTKGNQIVNWDGLTTPYWHIPGIPVPPGEYKVRGITHPGFGLKLRGFASSGGTVPWDDGPASSWGGDHGVSSAVRFDGQHIFLGWTAAEAGKALIACDLEGCPRWSNTHGGIAGAPLLTSDGKFVYVLRDQETKGDAKVVLYKLDAQNGHYVNWAGSDSPDLAINFPTGMGVFGGKLYLSHASKNKVEVLDANSGEHVSEFLVPSPGDLQISLDGHSYVLSEKKSVFAFDVATRTATPIIQGLINATALAVGSDGMIYVGERDPNQQVRVFDVHGKLMRTFGRQGGRPVLGVYDESGMRDINSLAVDNNGRLWVAEATSTPKRISVWNIVTGKLEKEFFGSTHYGASGGAINPLDPDVMVGEGCEWRMDATTGRSRCTGVFDTVFHGAARFIVAPNKRLYLVTGSNMGGATLYRIHERIGEGTYKIRGEIAGDKNGITTFWSDRNGDGQRQSDEVVSLPKKINISPYINLALNLGDDLTFFAETGGDGAPGLRIPLSGWTPGGVPTWDVGAFSSVPNAGVPSPDGKCLLSWNGKEYWASEIATGTIHWKYPNTFAGVHGSHDAPGPQPGLIRGALAVLGCIRLPEPAGYAWIISTNVGEWHMLTRDGFYLSRLFEPDSFKVHFPKNATPGADMTQAPPGLGGEDFGGSVTEGADGKIYIQAGKTGLWNLELTGVEHIAGIAGPALTISSEDVVKAQASREQLLQKSVGMKRLVAKQFTPNFTGNLDKDFAGNEIVGFQKTDDAKILSAIAWDTQKLYLGFDVMDATPWVNGAGESAMMYLGGDTVDIQLGTDPKADPKRTEPVQGDLRLSIGSVKGQPRAVIYRKASTEKHPRTFSSGVVKEYVLDSVTEVDGIEIKVVKRDRGYVLEAAIPLGALNFSPMAGLSLKGDVGVTHGDPGGTRTRLRTYWSNQHTGLVDDAVFELRIEPANWGEIRFDRR